MAKSTRAGVAVLALLLLGGPLALGARTAEVQLCPNVLVRDVWATIAAPAFTAGGAELTDYVVHPRNPSMILVTNGEQVFVTSNGGCNWRPFGFSLELLPGPDRPVSSATSRIVDLDIPEHPSGTATVYITVEEGLRGAAVRPHVFVKKGQDSQWRSAIQGLPAVVGRVWDLHVAPSNADVLYLHVQEDPATFRDDIYASLDGGNTWQKRSQGDEGAGSSGLAVDPMVPDHLWTWGAGGLWHSVDGGRSRSNINSVAGSISHVDVFHAPGAPARIMAYEPETLSFAVSRDGGATWDYFAGPGGEGISIAHGNTAEDVVFSQHQRVDRFKEPRFWLQITPEYDQPDLQELSADRTSRPSIFGMTPRTIERYMGLNQEIELPGFVDPLEPTKVVDDTSLQPAETTVTLRPDASKRVPYRFALPANPTPLDVFFLVDTTASMDSAIDGLRVGMQRIANDLAASKIDVQFGLGDVKDYPLPGYGNPVAGDFPYKLRREIGPVTGLEDALEQLDASGGGVPGNGDYEEAQLTGLYQAMTGEGEPGCVAQPDEDVRACVPPGQGAKFRPHALPVFVHITDYGFHDEPSHPSPSFDRVAQELSLQGAKQVGLAVWGTQGWGRATADLQAMAEATDTLAPDGGVDCDANGSIDLRPGQPLVCQLSDMDGSGALNIAPPIIATVKAVAEEVSVELVATDTEVVDVDRNLYPAVDITERNSLGFGVTFTCPPALAGTKHNITLAAHVQDRPVATAAAKLVCKGVPAALVAKRPKKEPLPPLPPVLPVFPPAAVAIPIVVPAGPPPVPETVSSTQSAAQAQGAIAKQEQEQVQVAVAIAQFKNDEAYALSSYTERSDHPSPVPLYLSAVLMSLAAGFVTLTRARVRTSAGRRRY